MTKPIQPCVEGLSIVLVDEESVLQTEQWLSGCQRCAENAATRLDYLLDALTGCDPEATEYVMCRPARCPFCSTEITEKTLVAL